MIEWANVNNGFLMVVLTLVYVTVTIAMMIFMAVSNHLTKKLIEQAEKFEQSRSRPYISIYIKTVREMQNGKKHELATGYSYLENSGATQARNVSVKITPEIFYEPYVGGEKIRNIPYFLNNLTPYLASKQKISYSLGFMASLFDSFERPIFKGQLNYEDVNGSKYTEKFIIDISVMRDAIPDYEEKSA